MSQFEKSHISQLSCRTWSGIQKRMRLKLNWIPGQARNDKKQYLPFSPITTQPGKRESRKNKNSVNKQFYVYILASKRNGTLYTGITSNLIQRVWHHKNNIIEGFTQKYNVKTLVFYEVHDNVESAIAREKRIKKWRRAWKLQLIEKMNPQWNDLFEEICQ